MSGKGKSNADTSHLSHEEIAKHDLHASKRPPGKSPGGVLHQQGGAVSRTGSYPVVLAGVLLLTGLGVWTYYRSSHPDPTGQAGAHSPAVQKAEDNSKAATQS